MRLLPELENALTHAHRTGLPVCRPTWFHDPTDARLRAVDDAFLLGRNLLVAPVVEAGARSRSVTLPSGGWYAVDGDDTWIEADAIEVDAPLGTTPLFARAGGMVVRGPALQHTGEPDDERLVTLYLTRDGDAAGAIVEDVGARELETSTTTVRAERDGERAIVHVHTENELPQRTWTFVVVDDGRRSTAVIGPTEDPSGRHATSA